MLTRKLVSLFILILLLPNLALASITCSKCEIGNCVCEITDCDSGILDIFSSTSCTMTPDYEFVFSDGYLRWSPLSARSYYVKALCDDGVTQSSCVSITVRAVEEKTTTTKKETTTIPAKEEEGGGPDYLLIILIVILIAVILLAAYYYFFMKKKGKRKTWEELYRKWGRR